jgi:hypothetical protein
MLSKASNIAKEPITMPQGNKLTKLPFAPESEASPHRASKASSVPTISIQTQKELMKHKKPL